MSTTLDNMGTFMNSRCPVCHSSSTRRFFESQSLPVHIGVLCSSRQSAVGCHTGDIVLAHCDECDLVFNEAFDPERVPYSQRYDNSLFFSPTFQDYSRNTAQRLVDTYGIRQKCIVEVGSGNGDFLKLLAETGGNSGVGIDPGGEAGSAARGAIVFHQEPFHPRFLTPEPDLICSRYVLEHIQEPPQLLTAIRRSLAGTSRTILYFEVPNAFLILKSLSVWDIIYEHCVYFTPLALENAFTRAGFNVLRVADGYGSQFVAIDASAGSGVQGQPSPDVNTIDDTRQLVSRFADAYDERLDGWRQRLARLSAGGGSRVILWGAGAKGVSLLNLLPMGEIVSYVVDINPAKQGCFIPGTGQPIVAPEHVRECPPDLVILPNPLYQGEVRERLVALAVDAEIEIA